MQARLPQGPWAFVEGLRTVDRSLSALLLKSRPQGIIVSKRGDGRLV